MEDEPLIYAAKEPNVTELKRAFEDTTRELEDFFTQCRHNYDDRRNYWPGKARDLRKHGSDAFPWDGASDQEAHVIDERINAYVALFMSAIQRANIRAYPVEGGDMARSKVTSSFLKWMITSYIPRFKKEMELCANMLLERGICMTYVGWHRQDKTYLQRFDLNQIANNNPQVAQAILSGEADDQLVTMIQTMFPMVKPAKARKVLNQLRKEGMAELPVVKRMVDRPTVQSLSPDGDFFFPSYVTDPQRAPYCFWRTYLTAQELKNKVSTDGWDADWVDYIVEKYRGVNTQSVDREENGRRSYRTTDTRYEAEDLIEIIYGYQRLVDEDDNSEGIYCTVFHREFTDKRSTVVPKPYAKFELLNGYEDYPVVVTRLNEAAKRLYDVESMAQKLRGLQDSIKIERDARTDRNSMATLPPVLHQVGNPPSDWGPGRYVPYRRQGEFQFGPIPQYNPGSVEMERTLLEVADRNVGLFAEDPLSPAKRQYYVDKFLGHVQEVIKMAFKCFQRFGPDQVWFRVTGVPDAQKFDKGNAEEDFDINIGYDVLNADPETHEAKLQAFASLLQFDRSGRINPDAMIEAMAAAIDPVMADTILQPVEVAQQKMQKDVTDDLAKIFAGIEMPARPNGAQMALQIIEQYGQQPDVMQRYQADEAFKARIDKYAAQYTFAVQQQQNAQIGKIGTQPASMGDMSTQGMAT
jgi:hypothetical protein